VLIDLPTRGLVAIPGEEGLHVYDGNTATLVPHSGPDEIGRHVRVHEVSSIGKVLLVSERGIFEFTTERRVVPITLPFSPTKGDWLYVAVMPASEVALIFSLEGLFEIDRTSRVRKVPEIEGGAGFPIGVIPVRNIFLAGARSLYLVKDRRLSPGACQRVFDSY
jgi:hypothetical protein